MNFEEWYAKLGEWAEENTALNMSYAMQRHLARRLEEWESSPATPLFHAGDYETCPHPECVAQRNAPGR